MSVQVGRITVRADGLSGRKAAEYEATIVGMLRSFERFEAGKALMRAFAFYNRPVLIYPYDGGLGPCNASTQGNAGGLLPNRVSFSPQMFNGVSRCYPTTTAGTDPHEVLFHELVHAVRAAAGVWRVDNFDEVVAMSVANVFSAEKLRLVRDAEHYDTFVPVKSDPAGYMQRNTVSLSRFYHQMPEFFRWIAEVDVSFNPIRLYYLNVLRGVPRLNTAP